jgi:hypothetical protein
MPHYLCQFSYTKEAIKTLDEHPRTVSRRSDQPTRSSGSPSAKPSWPLGTTSQYFSSRRLTTCGLRLSRWLPQREERLPTTRPRP